MFTSMTTFSRSAPGLANAYRQVGVETGVITASPHKLVQMLLDGFQDAVVQARGGMRARQHDVRSRAIGRALGIVEEGLRASLNMAAGGELALNLDRLYAYVSQRLSHANIHNDEAALDECASLMATLQSAWAAIGAQVDSPRQ